MTEPLVHGWPRCAVCNQRVQEMTRVDDFHRNAVVYTARCHGDAESFELTMHAALDATRIEFGLAFERPALIPPPGDAGLIALTHKGT